MSGVGWLYAYVNAGHPGLVKLGHTTDDVDARVKAQCTAGNPYPHYVVGRHHVADSALAETTVHSRLDAFRENKEWFRVTVEHALRVMREVADALPVSPGRNEAPQSPAPVAPEVERITTLTNGRATLPEGDVELKESDGHATAFRVGQSVYWCYGREVYKTRDPLSTADAKVLVEYYGERDALKRLAEEAQQRDRLKALELKTAELRRQRLEAEALSPEGRARAAAQETRKQEEERVARGRAEDRARAEAEERARQSAEEERLERARSAKVHRAWTKTQEEKEARKDATNPNWREEERRRDAAYEAALSRYEMKMRVGTVIGFGLPLAALACFFVSIALGVTLTLASIAFWGWGIFVGYNPPDDPSDD